MVNRSCAHTRGESRRPYTDTANLIFKKSEIIYELEKNPAVEKHGVS
jgi:hypothetical protein